MSASDELAAKLAEIELDLGEGPSWESLHTRRPVLHPDLASDRSGAWPLALQAYHEAGLGAVHVFPLLTADINIGAVTLYWEDAATLTNRQCKDAALLARILARQLLRRALLASEKQGDDSVADSSDFSRREVYQATGMVLAQMRLGPDDALMVIRGHAYATGRPVRDVAQDIIDRVLDFTPPTD